uniref:receptor-like protein kinase FERONIA n=1 Tax=Erigeron canadensis TaxID=72917 RepID=UPI001CB8BF9A|nr:receptor-like protein kinase FERONIA [Erigeron canadensis]
MSSSVKRFDHLKIPLADIKAATNNFSERSRCAIDEFSTTYRGSLLVGGESIPISARRLYRRDGYGYGEVEFWREITLLSCLKHENIVSNIGYCDEEEDNYKYIIINKQETHESLDEYIRPRMIMIGWNQRLRVSVGIARALSYIHYDEGRDLSIIHNDIKSSTILLDENFEPKLSSFGFSKIISVSERYGSHNAVLYYCAKTEYMDPAYKKTGEVSHKSDVYSLGIVLFELLCGRLAIDNPPGQLDSFETIAKYHYENGNLGRLIDPALREDQDMESFKSFSETAYSCLNQDPLKRPNIRQIVRLLEKALELRQRHENPLTPEIRPVVDVEDTSYRRLEVIYN